MSTISTAAASPIADDELVVLSLGMGIDSVSLLARWALEPHTRPFPMQNLICVTAQTGDEYDATRRLMEAHALPLMREHNIRYVQLARAGQADEDGYHVLDDSRSPQRMHMAGRWRLSDELRAGGTVPTFASKYKRLCTWRAKGSVLDRWRADHLRGRRFRVVIGYSAEETWRMARDSSHGDLRNAWFPLADWAATREVNDGYLHEVFGEPFARSCCVYCPYQKNRAGLPGLVARWRAEPVAAAQALMIEHRALALNPNMTLFSRKAAVDLAAEYDMQEVLALYRELHAGTPWTLHEVRRIHHAVKNDPARRGTVWRSVTALATGTRRQMVAELHRRAAAEHAQVSVDPYDIARALVLDPARTHGKQAFPAIERMFAIAPYGADDKERPQFAAAWERLSTQLGLAA